MAHTNAMGRRARRLALVARCCAALSATAGAAPASAEETAGAQRVEPPRTIVQEAPTYPEGESTSTTVIVELVVETDGTVSSALARQGDEPFAQAAVDAARRYRFDPAKRAGKPVRARIRVAIDFTAPVVDPPAPPPPIAPPPPAAGNAPIVDEVQVRGSRSPVSSPTERRIGRAEIRMIPGAFGDPYRAIDTLPGVIPIVSGLPYYFIRGAPPSSVGYFVDEIRVPYLFHFGLGPGVIQPALIEEVSLHPAAYPARYGRYGGGVIAGQLREPPTDLRGEAQVRLYDAGAYVETPLGKRATAGVGGRYSYTAALLSAFSPDVSIDYRDYNARFSYSITDDIRFSAIALGSYDYASAVEKGVDQVIFASEFHRLDVRLDRQTSKATSRVALTLGLDRTRLVDARFAQNRVLGLRARHRVHVRADLDVEIGADGMAEFYGGDLPSPYAVSRDAYEEAYNFFSPRTDTQAGAWVSATYFPAKGFELTGTLRGDVYTSAGNVAFGPSPRASMRVPLSSRVAFLGALGIAPQPPAFAIPVPAVGYRGLPGGLSFAYQKSAGLDFVLPYKLALRTVGFHHTYVNLRDYSRDRSSLNITDDPPITGSPAQSYGLEVSLNRKLSERFGTFVSYTLSRTELGSTPVEPTVVAPFDRTHVFQIGAIVALGRGWTSSARFLTYTGWPAQDNDNPTSNVPTGARLPMFSRVDLRLEKRWNFRKAGHISFVIEGLNVTGTRDVVGRSCTPGLPCSDRYFGPVIIPSLGVEGAL